MGIIMKLTEKKLRRIIREEMQRLSEGDKKLAIRYSNEMDAKNLLANRSDGLTYSDDYGKGGHHYFTFRNSQDAKKAQKVLRKAGISSDMM